eukprot:5939975-Ditylum_brightwellii.AAC.1
MISLSHQLITWMKFLMVSRIAELPRILLENNFQVMSSGTRTNLTLCCRANYNLCLHGTHQNHFPTVLMTHIMEL